MGKSEAFREHSHLRPGSHIDEHVLTKIPETPQKACLVIANRREDRPAGGQAGRVGDPFAKWPDRRVRLADFREETRRQFECPNGICVPLSSLYVEQPAAPSARRLGDRSAARQVTAEKIHDEATAPPRRQPIVFFEPKQS